MTKYKPYGIIKIQKGKESQEKKLKKSLKNLLTNRTEYGIIKTKIRVATKPLKKKGIDTMKKLTKKDYFNTLSAFISNSEEEVIGIAKEQEITAEMMVDFLAKELEHLAKKNAGSGNRKLTPQQEANEKIKVAILENMENEKGYTITEMMTFPEIAEIEPPVSNQRISALVRQMLDESEDTSDESKPIYKKVEKRKSLFFLK